MLPFGELILLLASLYAWLEKLTWRWFFYFLCLSWVGGKILEGLLSYTALHLNPARLAVVAVFYVLARKRAPKGLLSMVLPSVILVAEDLLVANEPGIMPLENWLFLGALFLTSWLSSGSYWGMAAAVAGSLLIKEGFSLLAFGGLYRYRDVPEPFFWHASAFLLLLFGLVKGVATEAMEESGEPDL